MEIFSGIRGYLHAKRNGAPMHLYWTWLRERWKADLHVLAIWSIFWPFLLIRVIAYVVSELAECAIETGLRVSGTPSRRKQTDAAQEYRAWLAKHDKLDTLRTVKRKR